MSDFKNPPNLVGFLLCYKIRHYSENHIEFFTSYIGFFRKGLVQMLLDPKISIDLLKELIETYMPNYIFLPNSLSNDLKS